MSRIALLVFIVVAACSKAKDDPGAAGPKDPGSAGSGSAMAGSSAGSGSGSAMAGSSAGSGSATMAAGSGSAGSGAGSAAGSGSAGSAAGSGSAVASTGFDFDKLSHDDKVKFMKEQVMPAMKKEFQTFDAKAFANFNCKTCHGKNPQKTKFKMPNPELPKLDFAALKAGKQKPKMAEFMGKVVKPEMAKILQQAEYTESNPNGFGCLECHVAKK